MEYYTYVLIDSITGEIFYVGKGQNRRMYHHVDEVKRGRIPNKTNIYLYCKIREILSSGNKVKYKKVFITENEKESYDKEKILIAKIGLENLCNIAKGGTGVMSGRKLSTEHKRKLSESHKGHRHSEETKRKISDSHKGKTLSDKTKRKMSESKKRKSRSEETKRKISFSNKGISRNKGRLLSEETKKKISENNARYWLGKKHSNEHRKKLSDSHKGLISGMKGKKHSEEAKRKMSESKKGR